MICILLNFYMGPMLVVVHSQQLRFDQRATPFVYFVHLVLTGNVPGRKLSNCGTSVTSITDINSFHFIEMVVLSVKRGRRSREFLLFRIVFTVAMSHVVNGFIIAEKWLTKRSAFSVFAVVRSLLVAGFPLKYRC
jgi:hypothetical protein